MGGGQTIETGNFAGLFGGRSLANLATDPLQEGYQPMATVTKIAPLAQPEYPTVHWLKSCIERGKHEVFDQTIMLTPPMAEVLLALNTNNRTFKEVKLAQLIRDISEGRWQFNGTAIQIRKDGVLGDGQHRCRAVVDTGVSILTKVGFGLEPEAIDTLDIGAARTPGDIASLHGIEDPMMTAAVARLLIGYARNGGTSLGKTTSISATEIMQRINRDPGVTVSALYARGAGHKIPVAGSIVGLCHYLLSAVSANDAKEYLGQLANGAGLAEGDPALTVREFLIRRAGKGAKATGREKRVEAILRGWAAFREDRKLKSVSFTGSFPELD